MTRPRVHITEECLREGMQIESAEITIDDKVRLLDALSQTGLRHIVVGSFVSPRYTPQMAQIDELVARFTPTPGVRYSALALNERGRERMREWMPPLSDTGEPVSTLSGLELEFEPERRAMSGLAVGANSAAHQLHELS